MQDARALDSPTATSLASPSTLCTAASLIDPGEGVTKLSSNRSLTISIERRDPAESTFRPRKAAHILIAEDDQLVRKLNTQILRQAGYQITSVEDGQSAWEALCVDTFDLLITDNDMPNLTGVQLVTKLRISKVNLPIILASGSADFFSGEEYRWLNFSACLQKPYTPDSLLQTIARVLNTESTLK